MNKEPTYKEKDNDEKKGKKRYIERLAEDKEAQQEIENFLNNKPEKDEYEGRTTIRPFD